MRYSFPRVLFLSLYFSLLAHAQNASPQASQAAPEPAHAPQAGAAGGSGNPGLHNGLLISIQDLTSEQVKQTGRDSYLGVYLLRFQDGPTETTVLYRYTLFQHDYTKQIRPGMSIPYRVSGKHVLLQSQDGKEVKTDLCVPKNDKFRCGGMLFNVTFKQ